MIRHAVLYGKKGDHLYEYFFDKEKLQVCMFSWQSETWETRNSYYRTIEDAIKAKDDPKRVLLKQED